ncbi:unnamed protein product [Plutella xylostella]|uniref:(diamondback moth) hypothetical protein n=1 Tax=Plutella xylostella TaxID=51655 RepID=A0A8S4EA79_PLUXY|nr:unnamed protein product [Plutella xylostella]
MPLNLQAVRQYLTELRNSGGLHKDQAEKYRNVLMEILKNPEEELAECLKAFIEAKNQTSTNENDWQTIPILRNRYKRKKLNQTPSPDKELQLENRYSPLKIDDNSKQHTKAKPTVKKPPPIILYGIQNITKLNELIDGVLQKTQYNYKIVTKNQLRINCSDIDSYKKLLDLVREKELIGHTFTQKDQRPYRIVIKNLHPSTPIESIKEAIESTGNKVKGEIINARSGLDKTPLFTWFVNLEPSPNNSDVKKLKYIYHTSITIEDPIHKKVIPQCKRCQQYGHTRNNCMRPYRCVKCAENHSTTDCPIKDRNTPAICALCLQDHPANYKGCKVFLQIQQRKTTVKTHQKNSDKSHDTQAPKIPASTYNIPAPNKSEKPRRTYASIAANKDEENTPTKLEEILSKQAEKLDKLLDQMGSLMSLLTMLVTKLIN